MLTLLQQSSEALGGKKLQAVPHGTVMLEQVRTGGVVSTTVTVCVQVTLLVHWSSICQIRVLVCVQTPFVVVLNTVIVTLVPQQLLTTVGTSKFHEVPHGTTLF